MTEKTTTMKYQEIIRINSKEKIHVNIRLNDECKNGFQEFAITGTIFEYNTRRQKWEDVGGGAIGDKIAELKPEFSIFNELHLSDVNGIPMYAIASDMYHIKNGMDKNEFMQYYRVTESDYKILSKCIDDKEYYYYLLNLGILARWKKQADTAIKLLENQLLHFRL